MKWLQLIERSQDISYSLPVRIYCVEDIYKNFTEMDRRIFRTHSDFYWDCTSKLRINFGQHCYVNFPYQLI